MPEAIRQPCVYHCHEDTCQDRQADCFRAWGRHLLQSRERDSADLAYRLHEQLAQQLAGIKFSLMAMVEACGAPPLGRRLAESVRQLDQAMGLAREISLQWYPDYLRDLGLLQALRSRMDELGAGAGIVFRTELPEELPPMGALVESALFRIAEEALRNAVRHAAASFVRLEVRLGDDELSLTVSDNGRGLELRDGLPVDRSRWGLVEMQERALLSGGRLRFEATAGGGTRLSCAWRLPHRISPQISRMTMPFPAR